jgi:hypothetical protein
VAVKLAAALGLTRVMKKMVSTPQTKLSDIFLSRIFLFSRSSTGKCETGKQERALLAE